jgi:hypothetical protein
MRVPRHLSHSVVRDRSLAASLVELHLPFYYNEAHQHHHHTTRRARGQPVTLGRPLPHL